MWMSDWDSLFEAFLRYVFLLKIGNGYGIQFFFLFEIMPKIEMPAAAQS